MPIQSLILAAGRGKVRAHNPTRDLPPMSDSTDLVARATDALSLIPSSMVTAAKQRAAGAIENCWKAYHDPESGLKLREEQLAVASSRASSYIYGLAQFAMEVCPKKYRPDEVFGAMCAYAEAKLKEKHEVNNLEDALPCWKTFKSNIMGGLRVGLDPHEFSTEWQFRKAGMEARLSVIDTKNAAEDRRLVTESRGHEERSDPVTKLPTRLHIEPVRKFMRATSIASPLKLVLAQIMVEADYVKKGKEAEAEEILNTAHEALLELVDKRRIKDDATRLALAPPKN